MKTKHHSVIAAMLFAFPGTSSAETIAAWTPSANGGERGNAYGGTGDIIGADTSSAGILWTTAQRVAQGNWGNVGAVWPGSNDSPVFSSANYTSFFLEIAEGSVIDFSSFLYTLNTYGAERETINAGTIDEEIVVSTIQARLRCSLDNFATDIASVTLLPEDRTGTNNIPINFDLSEVTELQGVGEPIEFRIHIWEESTVATYNPFMWIDLGTGGCVIDGTVVTAANREVLAAWIPTASADPVNTPEVEPAKKILSPAIASSSASNVGKGGGGNAGAVWPSSVNTIGQDPNVYLETTLVPAVGLSISLTDYVINQFNTYGTTGASGWAAALRTSIDGFTEDVATTAGTDSFTIDFDLSGRPELQNLAAPITLRLYLWDAEPTDDPFMWTDIVGANFANTPGIQIIGTEGAASLLPPSILSAKFIEGSGFEIEAVNLTPGRTYDLAVTFDLAEPFTTLGLAQTAAGTTLSFIDDFADPETDTKAFYRIEEVNP